MKIWARTLLEHSPVAAAWRRARAERGSPASSSWNPETKRGKTTKLSTPRLPSGAGASRAGRPDIFLQGGILQGYSHIWQEGSALTTCPSTIPRWGTLEVQNQHPESVKGWLVAKKKIKSGLPKKCFPDKEDWKTKWADRKHFWTWPWTPRDSGSATDRGAFAQVWWCPRYT